MKANKVIYVLLILIIISVLFFVIVIKENEVKQPQRHHSIPEDAVWIGGVDGGFWFKVIELKKNNILRIIIYNDFSGEIVKDSDFILTPNFSYDFFKNKDLYNLITHYNGYEIILKVKDKDFLILTPILPSDNKSTDN